MPYSKRVNTIRALIHGHHLLQSSPRLSDIAGEANRITTAGRMNTDRGWLLAVLHTTRTLDTTLAELCLAKGWSQPTSLGSALTALRDKGVVQGQFCKTYQMSIVRPRNRYMHQANAMPQKKDATVLLSEMHTCVAHILALL